VLSPEAVLGLAALAARYLELLGFRPNAEPGEDDLKKAHRAAAMRWHPDRPHNRDRPDEAKKMFQASTEAYDYLMDAHRHASRFR